MLLTVLTYLILIAFLFIVWSASQEPTVLKTFGEPKDKGLGYLAVFTVSIAAVVIIECVSAVLNLLGIKEDLAQEIYDMGNNKKD